MMTHAGTDEAASRVLRLRRSCWSAIVGDRAMIEAVCALAAEGPHTTNGSIAALCAMYRELDGGHEAAAARLITVISDSDGEDQWLERVIADLGSLHSGVHDGLSLHCRPSDARASGLAAYLTAVRAAYFVLCLEKQRAS